MKYGGKIKKMDKGGKVNKKKVPTTKNTMGEGRIEIDFLDKFMKRGKYKDKEINSANDYVKKDLKKKKMREGGAIKKYGNPLKGGNFGPNMSQDKSQDKKSTGSIHGIPYKPRTRPTKQGAVKKGYHKMPDGTVMKDSAHKMKHGGMVGKCKRDGIAVRGKTKAGR